MAAPQLASATYLPGERRSSSLRMALSRRLARSMLSAPMRSMLSKLSARWLLEHLLQAEGVDRAMRSVSYQMKAARFPMHRDLAGFDFEASSVERTLISQLANLAFTDDAHNVVLIGGPGTGKTHLASALGIAGITRHGKRVRFFSTVDLVNALEQEKAMNKAGQMADRLSKLDLVILDELGYLPFRRTPKRFILLDNHLGFFLQIRYLRNTIKPLIHGFAVFNRIPMFGRSGMQLDVFRRTQKSV